MNNKHTVYRVIIGALTIILILVLGYAALMAWVWSPAISDHALSKFHVGMTKNEVTAVMGKPNGIRLETTGSEIWVYARPLQWANFIVNFNTNGTVAGFEHDK